MYASVFKPVNHAVYITPFSQNNLVHKPPLPALLSKIRVWCFPMKCWCYGLFLLECLTWSLLLCSYLLLAALLLKHQLGIHCSVSTLYLFCSIPQMPVLSSFPKLCLSCFILFFWEELHIAKDQTGYGVKNDLLHPASGCWGYKCTETYLLFILQFW